MMPIEMLIPYKKGQAGVLPDIEDKRDFQLDEIVGSINIDWENKHFNLNHINNPKLVVEHQGSSLSCVGQMVQKYGEILNYIEIGKLIDLSAKDIYGGIYLPQGGAYIRDGASRLVNRGVNLDMDVPSYMGENSSPPTEDFMRDYEDTDSLKKMAKIYQAKEYRNVKLDIDLMAQAIEIGYGLCMGARGDNYGWKQADIMPPDDFGDWGHAFLGVTYGMRNGKRAIKFINSWGKEWGDNGFGYLNEDYFTNIMPDGVHKLFSGWTIIDKKNYMPNQLELKDNHLYQLVEGKGGFGLAVGDKLIVDDTANLLASFIMRTAGEIKGKTIAVNQAQWDSVSHYNLKKELIK